MPTKKLDKYVKALSEKMDVAPPTSISILREQKIFVDENNLNLSAMVRDMLASFIAGTGKRTKSKEV